MVIKENRVIFGLVCRASFPTDDSLEECPSRPDFDGLDLSVVIQGILAEFPTYPGLFEASKWCLV